MKHEIVIPSRRKSLTSQEGMSIIVLLVQIVHNVLKESCGYHISKTKK